MVAFVTDMFSKFELHCLTCRYSLSYLVDTFQFWKRLPPAIWLAWRLLVSHCLHASHVRQCVQNHAEEHPLRYRQFDGGLNPDIRDDSYVSTKVPLSAISKEIVEGSEFAVRAKRLLLSLCRSSYEREHHLTNKGSTHLKQENPHCLVHDLLNTVVEHVDVEPSLALHMTHDQSSPDDYGVHERIACLGCHANELSPVTPDSGEAKHDCIRDDYVFFANILAMLACMRLFIISNLVPNSAVDSVLSRDSLVEADNVASFVRLRLLALHFIYQTHTNAHAIV